MSLIERLTLLINGIKASFGGLDDRVTTLEGKITVSNTAPVNPSVNDIWIDTT